MPMARHRYTGFDLDESAPHMPRMRSCGMAQRGSKDLDMLCLRPPEKVRLMARIIKSVSLDPRTAQIAGQIGNFSAFVRDALYQYEEHYAQVERHTADEDNRKGGLCNAMSRPYCRTCWPHGPPAQTAWLAFNADPEGVGTDWVQAQAIKENENAWAFVPNIVTPAPQPIQPPANGLMTRLRRMLV